MSRYRHYLEEDVLQAATRRLRHVFEAFDTVAVAFSGGKDSQVALHLTREVGQEYGVERVPVIFRDEELIPRTVVDHVAGYRELPWVDLRWYVYPLRSQKFILGKVVEYVQWDPDREWVRQPPPWGIRPASGDRRVYDQYTMDDVATADLKGKVAVVTGIRASESLMRYRASVNKLNESYITGTGGARSRVKLVKPIYDWEENDVLRFSFERGLQLCPHYSAQQLAGQALRVATPIHAEHAKRLHQLRAVDPELYAGVVSIFPEVELQERYWRELDREGLRDRYGQDYEGVRRYIEEHYTERYERELALKRFRSVMIRARREPAKYPPAYLLQVFVGGSTKREILPYAGHRSASA